jgi:hypothetical protein
MARKGPSPIAWVVVLSGLLLSTGLGGCATEPQPVEWNRQALADEPFTVNSPALVVGHAAAWRAEPSTDPAYPSPWWVNRNDDRLGLRTGPADPVDEVYDIYTYDRQATSGDRIHDHYHRSYRSTRFGRIYR